MTEGGGEGIKNCPNLRDVIYECSLKRERITLLIASSEAGSSKVVGSLFSSVQNQNLFFAKTCISFCNYFNLLFQSFSCKKADNISRNDEN